jgi:hypothetical protein
MEYNPCETGTKLFTFLAFPNNDTGIQNILAAMNAINFNDEFELLRLTKKS